MLNCVGVRTRSTGRPIVRCGGRCGRWCSDGRPLGCITGGRRRSRGNGRGARPPGSGGCGGSGGPGQRGATARRRLPWPAGADGAASGWSLVVASLRHGLASPGGSGVDRRVDRRASPTRAADHDRSRRRADGDGNADQHRGAPVLPRRPDDHASTAASRRRTPPIRWSLGTRVQPVRLPWADGSMLSENQRGRTSHERVPLLFAGTHGFGEWSGEVWGVHVAWSANHTMLVERLADGRRYVQGGELLHPGEIVLEPGESYSTPVVVAVYSDGGLTPATWGFHRRGRARHIRPLHDRSC